ncbi:TPA: hypothetical protein ACUA4C_004833 [Escherichia coli]
MNDEQKQEIKERIFDHVLISGDVYVSSCVSESAVELKVEPENEISLYKRLIEYVLMHGENLQELFFNETYCYESCFIKDVKHFKESFSDVARFHSLFNHDKGDTSEFVVSFPFRLNFDNKEDVNNKFKDIISEHVISISDEQWSVYKSMALNDPSSMPDANFGRDFINTMSRQEFAKRNTISSFEYYHYIGRLLKMGEAIGEIDGSPVIYSENGYYLYWNEDTRYTLESWLTFPAFPREWLYP